MCYLVQGIIKAIYEIRSNGLLAGLGIFFCLLNLWCRQISRLISTNVKGITIGQYFCVCSEMVGKFCDKSKT